MRTQYTGPSEPMFTLDASCFVPVQLTNYVSLTMQRVCVGGVHLNTDTTRVKPAGAGSTGVDSTVVPLTQKLR